MQMSEGDPHPSTLPGFRGTRDPERSVTRSRSGMKEKRLEFEDVQPQDIPNPTEDNFPRRCITQLPNGVSHIYYTGNELTNWDSMRVHGIFTTVFKVWKDIATLPTVRDTVVNIFGQFMDIRLGILNNRLIQVPYDDTWYILSNVRQLPPNIDFSHIKSGNVSIAHLRMYLIVEADREDDITITPAQYDWGSSILASLYHGLDTAVTTGGAITGFVQLLPYWFYEYCGVGHPIVKEEVKYHIDHRTVETITWEPWFDSTVSETEDVLNAKLLSRKRIPLQVPNRNCEYHLGDRCWRQVTGEVRIPLDPPLSMSPHISLATLHEMRQTRFVDCEQFVVGEVRETYASYWAEQILKVGHKLTNSQRMGNLDLFGPSALRASITPVVVTSGLVHNLSQDFCLPGEAEGPDLGWHMRWTERRERLPIASLRDPSPISLSYGVEELWYLTQGMRRLVLAESVQDAQRIHEVEEELVITRRQIDSIDHQLYAYDLHLRRRHDVRVVPLPPGGCTRTRQRGSGPRTRGGSTSRRGRGTGDDSE
ncbi:hypothetical protein GIB67_025250 [Kingdonia uniflora]|uniref:Aminotransferase-like plant mobile domain-containing protein n=1 Tax=Kingdonia uniflora TaxID=39325 RepID=A0A7J7NBJ5_9MAGN|nr:hypothetical protein GIB67_025250 [Kingdonia uniflora]